MDLLLQVDHEAGQCIPVGQRQLTDSLIQQGHAVAIILGFYKQANTFIPHNFKHTSVPFSSSAFVQNWQIDKRGADQTLRASPAASMKVLLRWKVSSGSGRLRKKSLRAPAMTFMSSTLLSCGSVFPLSSFSFSSFTERSLPETLYRPTWRVGR